MMLKLAVFLFLCSVAICALIGGFNKVDIDDEGVVAATNHAAKALGKKFLTPYHVKPARILKAEQQVVAGMNYRLKVIVGLTNCKKAEVNYEDIENCEFQDGISTYRKCEVLIYRDLQSEHKMITSGCILASRDEVNSS